MLDVKSSNYNNNTLKIVVLSKLNRYKEKGDRKLIVLDGRKRKINTRNEKIQKGRERRNTRLARSLVGLLMPADLMSSSAQTPSMLPPQDGQPAPPSLLWSHTFLIKSPATPVRRQNTPMAWCLYIYCIPLVVYGPRLSFFFSIRS